VETSVETKDDEREERAESAPPKAEKAPAAKEDPDRMLAELTEMRRALSELRDQQARYLWILFPIGALIAIQTILQATKL